MKPAVIAILTLSLALAAGRLAAQGEGEAQELVLKATGFLSHDVVPQGGAAGGALMVELQGHWHVNANRPADEMLIPTTLAITAADGIATGEATFPDPVKQQFAFSEEPLLVYEGKFVIRFPITVAASVAPGRQQLEAKLRYQACDNTRCLAPRVETVAIPLEVVAAGQPSRAVNNELFPSSPAAVTASAAAAPTATPAAATGASTAGTAATAAANPSTPGAEPGSFLDRALARFRAGSYLLSLPSIFLLGLFLSFTPCVYPVIPLTVSFFAAQSEKRGGRTFSLALVYVLGMAAMYSALGVVAALGGHAFGSLLGSPVVIIGLAAVMVALALSMFGVWEIGVPSAISQRLGGSPSGYAGAAFMGLTVGILAAPCIGPAIVGLMALVASIGKVGSGMLIFFTFALGLGFPFLVLGSASGAISRLPRSGEWMIWVRQFCGIVLLGLALYFLRPLIGGTTALGLGAAVAIIGGAFVGFVSKAGGAIPTFRKVKAVVGVLTVAIGLFLAVSALRQPGAGGPGGASGAGHIAWVDYEEKAFAEALASGKPVLVDFTAEWCVACKELEKFTFSDPTVADAAARFTAFRADVTFDKPHLDALRARYEVVGYPTVLIIDSKGSERSDLRVVQFLKADDFRSRLARVD